MCSGTTAGEHSSPLRVQCISRTPPPHKKSLPVERRGGFFAIYVIYLPSAAMISGITLYRSPTIPKSATSKMGAFSALLMATM